MASAEEIVARLVQAEQGPVSTGVGAFLAYRVILSTRTRGYHRPRYVVRFLCTCMTCASSTARRSNTGPGPAAEIITLECVMTGLACEASYVYMALPECMSFS